MTNFVTTTPGPGYIKKPDLDLYLASIVAMRPRPFYVLGVRLTPFASVSNYGWTQTGLMGGVSPMDSAGIIATQPYDLLLMAYPPVGGGGYYKFTGVAKDTNNAIAAAAVVKLFRTSTNEFQQQATTDPAGNFALYSKYSDGHQIVGENAAGTLVGATADTLVGVVG